MALKFSHGQLDALKRAIWPATQTAVTDNLADKIVARIQPALVPRPGI